jgi:hypothetical protein
MERGSRCACSRYRCTCAASSGAFWTRSAEPLEAEGTAPPVGDPHGPAGHPAHETFTGLLQERGPRWAKVTGEVQLTTEPLRVDDVIEVWVDRSHDPLDTGATLRGTCAALRVVPNARWKLGRALTSSPEASVSRRSPPKGRGSPPNVGDRFLVAATRRSAPSSSRSVVQAFPHAQKRPFAS